MVCILKHIIPIIILMIKALIDNTHYTVKLILTKAPN